MRRILDFFLIGFFLVGGGGWGSARAPFFGGLTTSLPRNLLRTLTQEVNILETYDTEIENPSAKSSSRNPSLGKSLTLENLVF